MYDEVIDSLDGTAEAQVEVQRVGARDFIVLNTITDDGHTAGLYLDSEQARTLAQILNRLSANVA